MFGKSQTRYLFYLTLAAVMSAAVAIAVIASEDFISVTSSKTVRLDKEEGTALLLGDVHVIHKTTGSTLNADKVFLRRDKKTTKPIQGKAEGKVHAVIHKVDDQGILRRTIDVRCREGEFDKIIEEALLSGQVIVKSHDFIIKADRVFYDLKREQGRITEIPGKQVEMTFFKNAVHSDIMDLPAAVQSDKPAVSETVQSSTSTPPETAQSSTTTLPEGVQANEIGKAEGFADEVRLDKILRKITLQGKVRFIDYVEETAFTAEKADIFLDQSDDVERIYAYEKVVISQPNRVSKADQAVFDYVTETINLIGNANVKEPDQMEISSSKISLYMKEEKGFIKGKPNIPLKTKVWVDE
jgi:lipopolysaccharide transport protein LptA